MENNNEFSAIITSVKKMEKDNEKGLPVDKNNLYNLFENLREIAVAVLYNQEECSEPDENLALVISNNLSEINEVL